MAQLERLEVSDCLLEGTLPALLGNKTRSVLLGGNAIRGEHRCQSFVPALTSTNRSVVLGGKAIRGEQSQPILVLAKPVRDLGQQGLCMTSS